MSRLPDPGDALRAELGRVERLLAAAEGGAAASAPAPADTPHPGLHRLAACFGLSPLERDLVLVALAAELSPALAPLIDRLTGRCDGRLTVAALSRTLARGTGVPDAVTAALAPGELLLRAGLVELAGDGPLPTRAVTLPPRLWPRLVDLPAPVAFPVFPRDASSLERALLAPSTRADAELAVARAARAPNHALIVVAGTADAAPEALAAAMAGALGLPALLVRAEALEDEARALDLRREATWLQAAVIVQGVPSGAALTRLAVEVPVPVLIAAEQAPALAACAAPGRWRSDIEVAELPPALRLACWRRHLDGAELATGVDLAHHAAQHRFGAARIALVAAAARERALTRGGPVTLDDLRTSTRRAAPQTNGLARRLEGNHQLADVVVPPATRRELALVCTWVRHAHAAVAGPAAGPALRAHGSLVCLFHGPPGTGKTLAARAIAGELGVDLLRIDLSQVVDKYIGETEKNLERVFDEAETAGAILFFDEADALFGKRTEVKDARDRYANVETAFLLQRLESHRGVCILASNLRHNIDEAFSRRIQVIAEFPLPGADDRLRIWERHLAVDHLDADADLPALARRFAISGGDICNAATTAVVLAAADGTAVAMRHLVVGVWREVKKSGRLVSPGDFAPWRDALAELERAG
jgi:hypothetical protein